MKHLIKLMSEDCTYMCVTSPLKLDYTHAGSHIQRRTFHYLATVVVLLHHQVVLSFLKPLRLSYLLLLFSFILLL